MRKKFTILSVSALLALVSLASCSDSTQCPVCEEDPDDDSNPSDNPGENPDDNPDDPLPDVPDPSEGLIDKEESPWNEEITNLMFNSLGGAILPFVDLGDGEIQAEYVKNDEDNDYKSYLELVGGNFLLSHLEEAVETYEEHYWSTVMVGDSFYASNELIDVSVEVSKNYNNLFELRAYYDEPFNPTDATSWDDVTSLLINEHFGRFEVPFTYLGTVNYDSSINDSGALVVTGGTWNDQVLGEFNAAFKDWTISPDEEILTTLYATHEVDGSKLSATIEQVNNKAQLTVSLEESFNKENQSSWSQEVKVAMDRSLNKTILPYVYLGSVYPTIDTASTNERSLTLVGRIWDNEILENAKSAFEADGGWESVASETSITFSKAIGNEDFEVVIEQNAEGVPVLRASREEIYNESTLTDYPETIKTAFKDKYGEEISIIPYLYLGTSSPTINNEIPAEHEQDLHKLVITGGKYDARVLEQFKAKYTSSNEWYVEIDNFEEDYGSDYDEYGDVLAVAIQSFEKFTYKVGLFTLGNGDEKTVYLEINRSENSGTQETKWSEESLANLEKALGSGVEIPHFDIGRPTLEFIFNEDGHLEFQFVADANSISYRVWCAINALTKDDWDVKLAHNDTYYDDEAFISSINATKDFNGKKVNINIEVSPSYEYRFAMFGNIKLVESYDSSKENGSWSDEIKKAVSDRYKIDLPFIYLGTDHPYIYEDPKEGQLMIIGNALETELFTNAREVLSKSGFLIDNGESYSTYIVATKENSDGNIVTVYVDYNDERPYITFDLTEVFKPGENKEWSKKIQDTLNKELPEGVTLPYLYLGTVDPSIGVENYDSGKQISIVGGNWDDEVISLAYEYASESESESGFTIDTTSETFTGYKLLEDKTAVRMRISKNSDDLIQLDVYVDEKPEEVIEGFASWKDFPKTYSGNVSDLMNQTIGSQLPEFVPLGLLPDSVSLSTPSRTGNNYMRVSSYYSNFKPYYLYLAMDELEKKGYEVTFNPFAEREMPGFVAKKSDKGGSGTTMITLSSSSGYYYDDENGLRLSALYLPDMSKFEGTSDFAESDRININNALNDNNASNDVVLPYVNLGSESLNIETSSGEVSITGYNYSEEIITGIKDAYIGAGWTIYDSYVVENGQKYHTIGGYLEAKNGHFYVLTVTPKISAAVYGSGSFSSDSISTNLLIQMA